MRKFKYVAGIAVLAASFSAAHADTLDVVKERGVVNCGVTTGFA